MCKRTEEEHMQGLYVVNIDRQIIVEVDMDEDNLPI